MSSTMATKIPAALCAFPLTASKAGHMRYRLMNGGRSIHHHLFSRPIAATQLRHLSSNPQSRPQGSATSSEKPASTKKEGRLSVLDRMGANRTTKIVIVVFLSICGTMEMIFYANVAYRYFWEKESERGM